MGHLPRLLSIGEFAELSGLSSRMLRFYADRDILVPAQTDQKTGYRRYLASQLMEARRLHLLREADFPARDIATMLNGAGETERRRLMAAQRSALLQKMEALRLSLELLDDDLSREDAAGECRLIRTADAFVVSASFRGNRKDLRTLGLEAAKPLLRRISEESGVTPPPIVCTYDHATDTGATIAAVACVIVEHKTERVLRGGAMATTLHSGPYEKLPYTLERLLAWAKGNRYVPTGQIQECFFPPSAENAPFGRVEVSIPVLEVMG